MANVWFCSDLHFGHKNIDKFRHFVDSEEHNRDLIISSWKTCVNKSDLVYVLGDACFTMETVGDFAELPGRKILIRGNHDLLDTQVYLKYFESVYGLLKYKEFWLSHAPIHPNELRGKVNLHGHVHYESIRKSFNPLIDTKQEIDPRYFNCCVENLYNKFNNCLVDLQTIRKYLSEYSNSGC